MKCAIWNESLEVGRIRRPSLDQAETGAEEEERHRQDSVVVVIKERTHPVAGNTEMIERDDGLMEYDEDRKEALEFLAHDPLEERRAVRRPWRCIRQQDQPQNSYTDIKCDRKTHFLHSLWP